MPVSDGERSLTVLRPVPAPSSVIWRDGGGVVVELRVLKKQERSEGSKMSSMA